MPPKKFTKTVANNNAKTSNAYETSTGEVDAFSGGENNTLSAIISENMISSLNLFLNSDENFDIFIKRLSSEITKCVCAFLKDRIGEIEANMQKMAVNELSLQDRINILERKSDELESFNKRSNLRFAGLKFTEKESIEDVIIKNCREYLKIELKNKYISNVYKLPGNVLDRPPIVLVRFSSYKYRDQIFRNKKLFKGSNIVVMEDLTTISFGLLRRCKELLGVKNCWTINNMVKAKDPTGKIHNIKNMNDIENLKDLVPDV